jgi:hypothetical protein
MPHTGFKGRIQMSTALLMSLACLGLAACGSSSSGSSSTSSTSAAGASTSAPVTTTATGTTQSTTGAASASGSSQLQVSELLARCMRRSGIDIPEPNAEGQFDTKGINESTPQFKTVVHHCIAALPKGHGG